MTTRREFLTAAVCGAAAPLTVLAQQLSAKVPRIGFLGAGNASAYALRIDALRAGLRDLGYVEGKNIVIEYRWAEGNYNRLPQLANDLVRVKIDVLVTHATPSTRAAREASATIPIVVTDIIDPVAGGFAESLARPGGNITGSTYFGPQLSAKRLELLKEAMPRITRVAWLMNPDNLVFPTLRKEMEIAAAAMKLELQQFESRQPIDFEAAFSAMAKRRVEALIIQEDPLFTTNIRAVAYLANNRRLPSAGYGEFAQAGGVIGYGVNFLELYRRAAAFVDKILKGAKPADLPIEQPTKFELVINMKTAKALGIKIPNSIMVRADRVIE